MAQGVIQTGYRAAHLQGTLLNGASFALLTKGDAPALLVGDPAEIYDAVMHGKLYLIPFKCQVEMPRLSYRFFVFFWKLQSQQSMRGTAGLSPSNQMSQSLGPAIRHSSAHAHPRTVCLLSSDVQWSGQCSAGPLAVCTGVRWRGPKSHSESGKRHSTKTHKRPSARVQC